METAYRGTPGLTSSAYHRPTSLKGGARVDPRMRGRGGIIGGLIAGTVALTACGSAQATAPRPQPVAVTNNTTARWCGLPAQPGNSTVTVRVGGSDRQVRLHIPRGYHPDGHLPLVLSLHG